MDLLLPENQFIRLGVGEQVDDFGFFSSKNEITGINATKPPVIVLKIHFCGWLLKLYLLPEFSFLFSPVVTGF